MNNEQIVNSIKTLCKNNDITITKLEETLGLSQGLISRWNKSEPSLGKIIDIADYFNASLDEVVGRGNIVNDKFIEKLILKTDNGELKWNSYKTADGSVVVIPKRNIEHHDIIFTDSPTRSRVLSGEVSYFTQVDEHYISIYAYFKYDELKSPSDIKLFIQPDDDAELFPQDYTKEQLTPLWLKVLYTLEEHTPVEIKVEEFKNSFVLDDKIDKKIYVSHSKMNISSINALMKDPSIKDVFKIISSDEFTKLQQMFSDPKFQTAIKTINSFSQNLNFDNTKED